jgi:hypothetical protein
MAARPKGKSRPQPGRPGEDWVSVTLEPKEGSSDREVVSALHEAGACEVEVLAPGFISAIASPTCLDLLRPLARISPKVRKQMH